MTAPSRPSALRWGILATGGIAAAFAADLRTAGLDLVAVGSRSQESADAFAARYGIARAHGSYEALAADPEVDIVYVATPHPMHHADARLALEHGKHVLVEKAFTLNRSEAQDLADLGREKGLLVMEAMWTRYLPHMVRLREIIAAGVLGEIRAVSADHTQSLPTDPAHRLNALELGGGALLDLGIYPISFVYDVLGAPLTVQATGRLAETGADAEVATIMTHTGGAVSTTLSSSRAAGPNTAVVLGTLARIEIDRVWYSPTTFRVIAADGTVQEEFDGRTTADGRGGGRGMQYQALAAERYVADGTLDSDLLPVAESVAIMGLLDNIRAQIGVRYPGEAA
ncbi:Gfo/Idh/MocA family protein [Microbacterium azadirachtae]|uniref:Gfo/Idh/MocA family protein n=1 Tax=Microbacterium azadirachtae TaxID=582680 RepID=UPI00088AAE54|nr:Gfo/Idh/MocA family oxidoreductase [Microbacterium azadirachtae]SDM03272.1 Predicted dehydrogenase [Microbacterium azadirachtae]SEG28862.1 Predicted dehydrogenase [Microbacterium azadirachtae]SEG31764.1 Predicted dehydrogenase [Microbacterium azadirachtae]